MTLRAGEQILPNCTVTNVTAGILTTQYKIRMSDGKLVTVTTHYVWPPIPIRSMDWSADFDDEEGPQGTGATESEAIADLLNNYDVPS